MKGKNVAVLEGPRKLSIISYSLVKTHDKEMGFNGLGFEGNKKGVFTRNKNSEYVLEG